MADGDTCWLCIVDGDWIANSIVQYLDTLIPYKRLKGSEFPEICQSISFLLLLSIAILTMISQLKFIALYFLCLVGASQFPSSPNGLAIIQSKLDSGVTLSFKEVHCECHITKPDI